MSAVPCDECHGERLSPESLAVTVGGINISAFCDKSVTEALEFIERPGADRPGKDDRRATF